MTTPPLESPLSKDLGFKRTNVRLPRSVHAALKRQALERELSIEDLVLIAVEKELQCEGTSASLRASTAALQASTDNRILAQALRDLRQTLGTVETFLDDSYRIHPLQFAMRFLEAAPFPINVKNVATERIVWCNHAYATLLCAERSSLVGQRLEDLPQLQTDQLSQLHRKEASAGQAHVPMEKAHINGKLVWYFPHQVNFAVGGTRYLGDVTLLVADVERSATGPIYYPQVAEENLLGPAEPSISALLAAFLENVQTVVALKRLDGRILWCNEAFLRLANVNHLEEVVNRTSAQIFMLPAEHPIAEYDRQVAMGGVTILGPRDINGVKRHVAHFPLKDGSNIEFLGIMSCETNDVLSSRTPRKKR